MEQKEMKITCPDGYEIDKEKSTFECIVFKPIKKELYKTWEKLPKTWAEFCKTHNTQGNEYWIRNNSSLQQVAGARNRDIDADRNLMPSKELAEAMIALCQLMQLRDCYNNDWTPDWSEVNSKYDILFVNNEITTYSTSYTQRVLSFKSEELRDEFLKNFKDLIEIAKPLL